MDKEMWSSEKYGKSNPDEAQASFGGAKNWFNKELDSLEKRLNDPNYGDTLRLEDDLLLSAAEKISKQGFQKGIKMLDKEEYANLMDLLKLAIDNGDLSNEDVAKIMGVSISAVKKSLSRTGLRVKRDLAKKNPILNPRSEEHPVKPGDTYSQHLPSERKPGQRKDWYRDIDEKKLLRKVEDIFGD